MAVSAFASGFGGITVLMQWGMVGEGLITMNMLPERERKVLFMVPSI